MNEPVSTPPPLPLPPKAFVPVTSKTLRRLFLTLFLRGRSSRGLQKEGVPKSVGRKLALTLCFYTVFGFFAFFLIHQPVFALSFYLHGMTLVFLGMFIASSSGEILFNKEEADILLHRPINGKELLWAKIRVLVEVSLWLGGAFNLVGLFLGVAASNGGWAFPLIHVLSTTLHALFCTSAVVMVYQLCLRWFGRERLDGLMTGAQVIMSVAGVLGGQIVPRLITRFGPNLQPDAHSWWMILLPPAWFAGLDDAVAGSASSTSWLLGGIGLFVTALVLWLAFGKLAQDYEAGLQTLNETVSTKSKRAGRRWLNRLVNMPPLSWWLRDSVSRASFLLTAAYLVRDRDVKLRVYPGMAPFLIMPIIFLFQPGGKPGNNDFGAAFAGAYLGMVPMLALNLLQFSQQWQAADIFRAAPMESPSQLFHGARRAVLCFLTAPLLIALAVLVTVLRGDVSQLQLLLPGIIALPVYSLVPGLGGRSIPLSQPTEEGQAAGRGMRMIGFMMVSLVLAGVAMAAKSFHVFGTLLLIESIVVVITYVIMRRSLNRARWSSME